MGRGVPAAGSGLRPARLGLRDRGQAAEGREQADPGRGGRRLLAAAVYLRQRENREAVSTRRLWRVLKRPEAASQWNRPPPCQEGSQSPRSERPAGSGACGGPEAWGWRRDPPRCCVSTFVLS